MIAVRPIKLLMKAIWIGRTVTKVLSKKANGFGETRLSGQTFPQKLSAPSVTGVHRRFFTTERNDWLDAW